MSDLIFYTNPMSRGQIVRWMLEEIGQPYETQVLGYGTSMKSPEYLAINPMGKVPAIVHKGNVVTEASAICAYLADTFPEAGLLPDPANRAPYFRWMFFTAGPMEQAITNNNLQWNPAPDQMRMVGYGCFDDAVKALETAVAGRKYIAGSRFSSADVYVGSHIDWGLQFGTLPQRDAFSEYVEPLRERPAYKRGKEIDNALIAEMQQSPAA